MENIPFIFSNYYIDVAFLAWLIAQVLKTLINFLLTKEFVWERMVGAGGMPSSHSALVCSLTVALSRKLGFTSPEFALSLVFAAVVMYDAMGVRRAAGEQAKVLNKIVAMTSDNIREMFAPQKKSDIRNLFIRRKTWRRTRRRNANAKRARHCSRSCWDTPRWRCWQVRCWELLWQC